MGKRPRKRDIAKNIFGEMKPRLQKRIIRLVDAIKSDVETASSYTKTVYHFQKLPSLRNNFSRIIRNVVDDMPSSHAIKLSREKTGKLVGVFNALNETVELFYKPKSLDNRRAYRNLFQELGIYPVHSPVAGGVTKASFRIPEENQHQSNPVLGG